ncbi:hypothetical protein FACS18942_01760 [Planctomycetales bacterium]|nr:hypothetical protein FACS18942_01760 [Planctomycetales bacterium]
MLIAALAMATQANAQQTFDIDSTITGSVYGNGSGSTQTTPPPNSTTIAKNNTVNVVVSGNNYGLIIGSAYGAYADSNVLTLTISGNKVNVQSNGTVNGRVTGDAYGGYAKNAGGDATASENTATISGTVGNGNGNSYIQGAYANTTDGDASVNINTVHIFGTGIVNQQNGFIEGGHAHAIGAGTATANGNNVIIDAGADVNNTGYIAGGSVGSASGAVEAINNGVTIETTGRSYNKIYGGRLIDENYYHGGDIFTGNTLNLAAGNTIYDVKNMNIINFTSSGEAGIGVLDTTPTGAANSPLVELNTQGTANDPNTSYTVTFGGKITGDGGIDKKGGGTLTLTRTDNDYGGDTVVSGGTLAGNIVAGTNLTVKSGATYDGTGEHRVVNTLNGAGTIINDVDGLEVRGDGDFSGVIQGDGYLYVLGSTPTTELILSGNNIYTGGTIIAGGVLAIEKDDNIGGSGSGTNYLKTGTLQLTGSTYDSDWILEDGPQTGTKTIYVVNGSGAVMNGELSGDGGFTKDGDGLLILAGNNTYKGKTVIDGGILSIEKDGNIGSGTNFLKTGTLQLSGSTYNSDWTLEDTGSNADAETKVIDAFAADVEMKGVLSGDGGFTKGGDRLLILAGNNTYEGDTVIDTVGLVVTGTLGYNGGNEADYAGNIILNGYELTFAHAQDGNQTLSGVISDGDPNSHGNLVKSRAGTLTLTGNNTYTGDTTVNTGTLKVTGTLGWNGTTGDYAGNILNNGDLVFDQSATQTLSGVISGSGGLTKDGDGTLTLSGTNNTYNGGTTVSGGTLSIGRDENIGNGTNTLAGGTLRLGSGHTYFKDWTLEVADNVIEVLDLRSINLGNAVTLSGSLKGNGGFAKTGAGYFVLDGVNTYLGDTEVREGWLEITGNLGNGDYAGNILNDGTLNFDQNVNQTLSGDISGSGELRISMYHTGKLTLTGNNTYTGGTTVSGGILAGDTSSLQGNIVNNAAVEFTQTTNGTYTGTMSGTGSLTKDGTEKLTLSTDNTYSGDTTVSAGTLEVTGNLSNSNVNVVGGAVIDLSGNAGQNVNLANGGTLDWRGNGTTGGTIGGNLNAANANLNFYVPTSTVNGNTLLTVNGTADISDSTVNVGIDGTSSPLQTGEQIRLIDAAGGLTGKSSNDAANGQGMAGVSLRYEFDLTTTSNQLLATITKVGPNEQTKAFSEARLSQLAFSNQGTDLIADQGLSAALDAAARRMKGTTLFGTLSGGTSRYNTGSHSDVSGVSLVTGLTGSTRQALGKLTLGAFFEYGDANYDSYNSFITAASVRGRGDIDYTGGGVLAHLEFNPNATGNAWLESSARFGESSLDFRTGDITDYLGRRAAFAGDTNYAGAHIGLGYHFNLTKQNGLDFYAQYLWSRLNADTFGISTGESVKFEELNSKRLRLGSRFVYAVNSYRRSYAGIAWEHEYGGAAEASIYGYSLDVPKLTGDTCKLELGLTLLPTKTCPFTRNLGLQGYLGKREGAAGNVEVRYAF